ncbi:MAG: hypothetical protein QGM50_09885 [Anaerolineae bacterium]|nr:hypothetical protein [Anaerolineae bacterium]
MENKKKIWLLEIVVLFLIAALVYTLDIGSLSFFRDDWYYAYDYNIAGSSIFHEMFRSDRPARGIFFDIYFTLFGVQTFYYHLGAYLWRMLGAIGALWLFRILWPRQRIATFIVTLLFVTYPGYFWWVGGIEFQPHIASLSLQVVSIALTLKALQDPRWIPKIILMIGSILTGWSALSLVEYAIGMEIFRILCVMLFIFKSQHRGLLKYSLGKATQAIIVPLFIPSGYLVWRLLIFENTYKPTDVRVQMSHLLQAPLDTILLWIVHLFQSTINVSILAWAVPFSQNFFKLQKTDQLVSLLITVLAILIFGVSIAILRKHMLSDDSQNTREDQLLWHQEAIGLGLAGVIFGVLPIVVANRYVSFPAFSHYALPASLAAALLMTGLIYSLKTQRTQVVLASLLIGVAILTHRSISLNSVHEESEIQSFWWQVYWRIPSIKPGSTLAVDYPSVKYGEDADIAWGPANFMYYPEKSLGTDFIKYKIAATPLTQEGILNIVMEDLRISRTYRNHSMFLNYRRVLVISQPSVRSCIQVRDIRWPEISEYDSVSTIAISPHSKIENVQVDEFAPVPLSLIFGPEPIHDWCYYYQKTSLARQKGDWKTVSMLGKEAVNAGYAPTDLIEWMPFLQAYAYLDDTKGVELISSEINNIEFYRLQVCKMPALMEKNGYPLSSEMSANISDLFCEKSSNKN